MMNTAVLARARNTHGVKPHRAWLSTELAPLYPVEEGQVVLVNEFVGLHGSPRGALLELNDKGGTAYKLPTLAKWRRGEERAPAWALGVMRRQVLESRFGPTITGAFIRLLDLTEGVDNGVVPARQEIENPGHELI